MELFLNARLPRALHSKLRDFAFAALRFQTAVDPTTGALNLTPWVRHFVPKFSRFNDYTKGNNDMKSFIQVKYKQFLNTIIAKQRVLVLLLLQF